MLVKCVFWDYLYQSYVVTICLEEIPVRLTDIKLFMASAMLVALPMAVAGHPGNWWRIASGRHEVAPNDQPKITGHDRGRIPDRDQDLL